MTEKPWTLLDGTEHLAPETISARTIQDQDLVAWRTSAGIVCVMEARCPHQFSHLGAEGSVDGEEIVCCTHYWRFDTHGNGTYVGADGARSDRSPIAVFASKETAEGVWVQLR